MRNYLLLLILTSASALSNAKEDYRDTAIYFINTELGTSVYDNYDGILLGLDVSMVDQGKMYSFYGTAFYGGNEGCWLIECTSPGALNNRFSNEDIGFAYGWAFNQQELTAYAQMGAGYGGVETEKVWYGDLGDVQEGKIVREENERYRTPHIMVRAGFTAGDLLESVGFELEHKVNNQHSYTSLSVKFSLAMLFL